MPSENALPPQAPTAIAPITTTPQTAGQGKQAEKKSKQVSAKELADKGFFQDFTELNLDDLLEAETPTIVTTLAAGREQSVDEAAGAITVIESERLRDMGAQTLIDALSLVPGVDVLIDSLGRQRIVMRGVPTGGLAAHSESILIMHNGHRLNEAVLGGATAVDLDIPLVSVKRIEVQRGPLSALFGEGALAGIINIVTDQAGEFTGIEAGAGLGSLGVERIHVRLGAEIKGVKVSGALSFADSDGIAIQVQSDAQTLTDQRTAAQGRSAISFAPARTRDAQRALSSLYRVAYRGFELDWRVSQNSSGGFIGYANTLGENNDLFAKQSSLALRYQHEIARLGRFAASAYLTQNRYRDVFEILPPGYEGFLPDGRFFRYNSSVYLQTDIKS
ncbi:MAG: TonB-dependent receptor plug domain-containing protein, partial [Vicinamibacteria bacterium]|nr:TonB-dependent receptor plug domain-containing protein [Vicinamibacteria bacterium]